MPEGTPVKVNGVIIALSGKTGRATGPHTHVQKVEKGYVVNPAGGGYKVPSPATVIETGEDAERGKYVKVKDAKGVEWSHFHNSEIKVSKGKLEKEDMYKNKSAQQWYDKAQAYLASAADWEKKTRELRKEYEALEKKANWLDQKVINRDNIIDTLQKQINDKPPMPLPAEQNLDPVPEPKPKTGFWEAVASIFKKK